MSTSASAEAKATESLLADVLKQAPGLGILADFAAATLLADPLERQGVLETLDIAERAGRVRALLERSVLEAGGASLN